MCGLLGGPGNVDGSGDLKKCMLGLVGSSSLSAPLHVALPLRDDATQVYKPPSRFSRSAEMRSLVNEEKQKIQVGSHLCSDRKLSVSEVLLNAAHNYFQNLFPTLLALVMRLWPCLLG